MNTDKKEEMFIHSYVRLLTCKITKKSCIIVAYNSRTYRFVIILDLGGLAYRYIGIKVRHNLRTWNFKMKIDAHNYAL